MHVSDSFFMCFAIANATWKVGHKSRKSSPVFFSQWQNNNGVVSQFHLDPS